jgi:DnaK suppressor protein
MNTHPKRSPRSAESVRERLQGMRAELLARQQRLHAHFGSEARSADASERAVESENDEVVESLERASALELASIDKAIARLDAGTYGCCSRCGAMIEPARLQALPQATTCFRCAGLT